MGLAVNMYNTKSISLTVDKILIIICITQQGEDM